MTKKSGWHGEPRRHGLARKGVKTVIDDDTRLAVNNYVARGIQKKSGDCIKTSYILSELELLCGSYSCGDDYAIHIQYLIDEIKAKILVSDDDISNNGC